MGTLWTTVTAGFQAIITCVGDVVTAFIGTDGALKDLLPLFVIGIGVSLLTLSVRLIRKITWG